MKRASLAVIALVVGCAQKPVEAPKGCVDPVAHPLADDALLAAVGDARIVALGEADHGDRAIGQEKARLVRLLHDRAGFDVLAFESSLWDVHRMENDLRRGTAVEVAAHEGLFPNFADDPSVRALLSSIPPSLHLAGFDPQFSGDDRELPFARMLDEVTGKCAFVPEALRGRLEAAFKRFPKRKKFTPLDADTRDNDALAFAELRALLQANSSAFTSIVGMSEAPYVLRTLDSIIGLYEWHRAVAPVAGDIDFDARPSANNVRDRLMAENLAWVRAQFPGKKIILWAATSHLVRALPPSKPGSQLDLSAWVPMGALVARDASAKYFVVGIRADPAATAPSMIDVRAEADGCAFTARAIGNVPMTNVWSRSLDVLLTIPRASL